MERDLKCEETNLAGLRIQVEEIEKSLAKAKNEMTGEISSWSCDRYDHPPYSV